MPRKSGQSHAGKYGPAGGDGPAPLIPSPFAHSSHPVPFARISEIFLRQPQVNLLDGSETLDYIANNSKSLLCGHRRKWEGDVVMFSLQATPQ